MNDPSPATAEATSLGPRNDVPHPAIKAGCCRFRDSKILTKLA
jgi:hypothetical protein